MFVLEIEKGNEGFLFLKVDGVMVDKVDEVYKVDIRQLTLAETI